MPEGNTSDLPEPIEFKPDHEYWALEDNQGWGPPDLIIESPPFTVPANSGDQWWEPGAAIQDVIDRELVGERWIRAVETRPADAESGYVFHHANTSLRRSAENGPGGGLSSAAVGKEPTCIPKMPGN